MATRQDKSHRREARDELLEGHAEGGGEFLSALVIEQVEELCGEPGGGFAALEGGLKEGLALGDPKRRGGRRGSSPGLFLAVRRLRLSHVLVSD
jgi:hypothetical protein